MSFGRSGSIVLRRWRFAVNAAVRLFFVGFVTIVFGLMTAIVTAVLS